MNKIIVYLVVSLSLFIFGCASKPSITIEPGLITVNGTNYISNTLTIDPGTRVVFKELPEGFVIDPTSGAPGKLIITNGGRLVAIGTKEKPINFVAESKFSAIVFISGNQGSILQYCDFSGFDSIDINDSITMKYCKVETYINFNISAPAIIQYNTLNTHFPINITNAVNFQYNDVVATIEINGISVPSSFPTIRNNNIYSGLSLAINNLCTSSITVSSNYIHDSNGKTGVDIDGSQSYNTKYDSPQISPIASAGCGW